MCNCPGQEFACHYVECPEKNGKYSFHFERIGTRWDLVLAVLIAWALFAVAVW